MKRKRFSVEQIVGVLKHDEVGVPVTEVIRKAGISEQTFYRWKKQYVGLEVDQVRQLKQVQEENTRLKQLVAELTLDKVMLQDVLAKKVIKPSRRRPLVEYLCDRYRASERHACSVLRVPRAKFRYRSCENPLDRAANADSRTRADARAIWLSQDSSAGESRRLESEPASGLSALQRRRPHPEKAACSAKTNRRSTAPGKVPSDDTEPGVELGFCERPTGGWVAIPCLDHRRYLYPGKSRH